MSAATKGCAISHGSGPSWLRHAAEHVLLGDWIMYRAILQATQWACMLQDNVRYGNEAQLLGGYSAGWLLLSAAMALAYLGLWLRCALLLRRLTKAGS